MDDARSVICRTLAANPKNPWIHYELSRHLAAKADREGALKEIRKALQRIPSSRAEHVSRALATTDVSLSQSQWEDPYRKWQLEMSY